jgi:hypothetical protein
MSTNDTEVLLRAALNELTSTTPLINPDRPRTGTALGDTADGAVVRADFPPLYQGDRRRHRHKRRILVGAAALVVGIAGFALALSYGPRSSDVGGSGTGGALCATCATGSSSPTSFRLPTETGTPGLRDAARAWSEAFLTGTVANIRSMEGASCLTTPTIAPAVMEAFLKADRAEMERYVGVPLASIRIKGVQVRDVTATTGDAEVQYDLPSSVVGNDNWVSYGYQDGQWKETNCQAPIGGESSSPSEATP